MATAQVKDVMTEGIASLPSSASIVAAACMMRDRNIGDVLVTDSDRQLCGVVTDRDIVLRAVAADTGPAQMTLRDVCTPALLTVDENASIDEVVQTMREHSIRRLPVLRNNTAVGFVTIGDLARAQDASSALADISAAAPNN